MILNLKLLNAKWTETNQRVRSIGQITLEKWIDDWEYLALEIYGRRKWLFKREEKKIDKLLWRRINWGLTSTTDNKKRTIKGKKKCEEKWKR